MIGYVIAAFGLAALIAGGAATWQTKRLEEAQKDMVVVEGQLATCAGRLGAILRDVESDNEIDNLDLTDFDIPAGWLREGISPDN